jgi:hypothetical protein
MRLAGALLISLGVMSATQAADILEAHYDTAADELVVDIAYRGTNPDHEFAVEWGRCSTESPPRTVGRLVDRQGSDMAREDYRVEERLALDDIPCRPAIVTLRLGRAAHTDVYVPRQIDLLEGRPDRPYQEIGRIAAYAGRGRSDVSRGAYRQGPLAGARRRRSAALRQRLSRAGAPA